MKRQKSQKRLPLLQIYPAGGRHWSEKVATACRADNVSVAIARAVLKDAPLLILDEATSAVDNETEAALQRSIERISRDRTTIVIAHRLSTVRNADRIVVLEEGEVIEDGRHDDLVNLDGVYARLWSVQTGEAR